MKYIYLFLNILSLTCIFALAKQNQLKNRRIGGPVVFTAKELPPYVVQVRVRKTTFGPFVHQCMGTLLAKHWSITADLCLAGVGKVPLNKTILNDIAIFYGSTNGNQTQQYDVVALRSHDTENLALLNHARIDILSTYFPKLTRKYCPTGALAVYHSYGRYNGSIPSDLTYSTNRVNEEVCKDTDGFPFPDEIVCVTSIDQTKPTNDDVGTGLMTGYGPGPTFPLTHDVKLIGVAGGIFEYPVFGKVLFGRQLSEYITWIKSIVHSVQVVD